MTETKWLYDDPESCYHDIQCLCDGHCGNCYADLDEVRVTRARLISLHLNHPGGVYTEADQLHPRARYCSPYCKGRAKRERALDRRMRPAGRADGCGPGC